MQQKNPQQKSPENPANTGGKERVPGYPQDKNPAGTPNPPKEEFPGQPPKVYAQQGQGPQPGQGGRNPDTNQPPRRDDDPSHATKPGGIPGERQGRDDDPARRKPDENRPKRDSGSRH
jgi:hypothetical protein